MTDIKQIAIAILEAATLYDNERCTDDNSTSPNLAKAIALSRSLLDEANELIGGGPSPTVTPSICPLGSIQQGAESAIALLRRLGCPAVVLLFNELPITVYGDATVESVVAKYYELRREHHYAGHCPVRDAKIAAWAKG